MKIRKDQRGYEFTSKGRDLSQWVDDWLVEFDKKENASHGEASNPLAEFKDEE